VAEIKETRRPRRMETSEEEFPEFEEEEINLEDHGDSAVGRSRRRVAPGFSVDSTIGSSIGSTLCNDLIDRVNL
jgi:hypothetical protein